MTSPISGSDSNRNVQNQPKSPSGSAEQSAAQSGRNIGREAAIFQSQVGSPMNRSTSLSDIKDADEGDSSSSSTQDSSSTQSTADSRSDQKVTEKKDDKKEGGKDDKKTDDKAKDATGVQAQQQTQTSSQMSVEQKAPVSSQTTINSIITQVVDKLQVSMPQLNGGVEVRMTLKTSGLAGTEVKITKLGNDLSITFDSKSPDAMKFLADNIPALQDAMNNKLPNLNVNINVGDKSAQQQNNEGRSRGGGGDQQEQQGQQGEEQNNQQR